MDFPLIINKPCVPVVSPDPHCSDVFKLQFSFRAESFCGVLVTVRVGFNDPQTGADVVFLNMTTMPEHARGHGYGGLVIHNIVATARQAGLAHIRATQVSDPRAEHFWEHWIGMKPVRNHTNDYLLPHAD